MNGLVKHKWTKKNNIGSPVFYCFLKACSPNSLCFMSIGSGWKYVRKGFSYWFVGLQFLSSFGSKLDSMEESKYDSGGGNYSINDFVVPPNIKGYFSYGGDTISTEETFETKYLSTVN